MRWICVPTLLLTVCLSGCGSPTSAPSTDSGQPSPSARSTSPQEPASPKQSVTADQPSPAGPAADLDFTATTLDGDSFHGASLEGRPAVLWFWAPWCPTCRAQIPNVTALAEGYGGQVSVVAVGGLDSEQAITDLARDIPHVTHLVDSAGEVWRHFGVTAQSTYTVISGDGRIVSEGYLDDGELNELVADLAD